MLRCCSRSLLTVAVLLCLLCTVQSNASKLAAGTAKPNNSKMHFPATWSCTGVKQASKTVAVRKQNQKANHLSNTKQAQRERDNKKQKKIDSFCSTEVKSQCRKIQRKQAHKFTNLQTAVSCLLPLIPARHVMKKPHMEFLIVMGCSLRELKALKQVEYTIFA